MEHWCTVPETAVLLNFLSFDHNNVNLQDSFVKKIKKSEECIKRMDILKD